MTSLSLTFIWQPYVSMYTFGFEGSVIGLILRIFVLVFLSDTKIGFFAEYSYLCKDVKCAYMKIKRLERYIFLLIAAVLMLPGCANLKKIREIKVNDVKVESIIPNGLKGVVLNMAVEVDNPASQLSLTDISAALEHSGKVLGRVVVDPFTLQGKSVDIYRLKADVTLGEGMSILELAKFADKAVLEESVVDFSAKVKIGKGSPKNIRLNDVPLKKLLETVEK